MTFSLRVLGVCALVVYLEKPARALDQPWGIYKSYGDGFSHGDVIKFFRCTDPDSLKWLLCSAPSHVTPFETASGFAKSSYAKSIE
jgi:hypothetical protein